MTQTTTHDATTDRYEILRDRITALSLDERSQMLFWLSGYRPDAVERALDWLFPCPVCNGQLVIPVSGPDQFGNYDTDDCPCQTVHDFDPEERREP